MLSRLKEFTILNLKNIPGWRTKWKIVVFECDDWGGIRMPSKKVFEYLNGKGLNVATSRFNEYDTLETCEDLEYLYEVLFSVRDRNNNPAVFTPMTVMVNPDFKKIKSGGFLEYHYKPFTETLKTYYPHKNVFKIWQEGINKGIFVPELHGREHITVQLWLERLREGNEELLKAFEKGFVSLNISDVPSPASGFRAEYYFTSEDQKPFLEKSIKESVELFKSIFGYKPGVFVPGNGIFHADFDRVVAEAEVEFLNVFHSMAYPVEGGKLKYRRFTSGEKGPGGITYYTRNCAFEPTDSRYRGIDLTLKQIAAAFRWGKPANISTHRVNFAGGIERGNRERGLKELKLLLNEIVKKWPDVVFMSSANALGIMKSGG